MRILIQLLLVGWAVMMSALVILPSIHLLETAKRSTVLDPPKPPEAPAWPPNGQMDSTALTAYLQQVATYQQAVTAYKAYAETMAKFDPQATYTLVVKETVGPFFGQVIVAFLGFALVKVGGTVVNNLNLMRHDKPSDRIELFG